MKFLSQGRLSSNKKSTEGINEWCGNELCSNMMDNRNIISVSKKVVRARELVSLSELCAIHPMPILSSFT